MRHLFLMAAFASTTAVAGDIYLIDADTDELLVFETVSQALTPIGPLGFNYQFGGLAYSPDTGEAYVTSRGDTMLRTVDLASGATAVVGDTGVNDLFGLAYDPNTGLVWGWATNGQAYIIDTTNGTAIPAYSFPYYPGGCGYSPAEGGIVCINAGGGDIYLEDTIGLTSTLLANPGSTNDIGAAFDPDTNQLWGFDYSSNIFSYDAAYNRTTVGSTGRSIDAAESIQGAAPQFTLTSNAACPGPMTITASNATPNGNVVIARGTAGSSIIPAGPCAGRALPIGNPRLVGTFRANGAGSVSLNANPGAQFCGVAKGIAVDLATCRVSTVLSL